jgi:nucleotide-binding universal stress UspA family protein
MLTRIAHATDLSPRSDVALLHALRLAVATRSRLDILHVKRRGAAHEWHAFPRVREPLQRWGLLDPGDQPDAIDIKLGLHVAKVEIDHKDPTAGLIEFILGHRPDLLTFATHGREGFERWLNASVSEETVRRAHVPALLIGPEARGFVEAQSGHMQIDRVLVPVAAEPSPAVALQRMNELLAPIGVTPDRFHLMNVTPTGNTADPIRDVLDDVGRSRQIERFEGPVVETILSTAVHSGADLIAMPTMGRHGFLDGLRGSTTSRVVAHAACPVLTLPLIGR